MKRCSACKQAKPPGEFYRNRTTHDGLGNLCKPCQNDAIRRTKANRSNPQPAHQTAASRTDRAFTPEDIRHMARIVLEGTRQV